MPIQGYLEFVGPDAVRGWAWDSATPNAHLEVIVRLNEQFIASGKADIRRSDLGAAGIGDGEHGFNIDLSGVGITDVSVPQVDVQAVSGADSLRLPRTKPRSNKIVDLESRSDLPLRDDSQSPVFILGPARSGTSAVALGLLHSGRYEGSGEGHLLPLAHALLATVDTHYGRLGAQSDAMISRVPVETFQKFIRRGMVKLIRDLYPTGYWLDKTPTVEMVRAAPLMQEVWPNAKFIFMKRRVIENILSRRRRFPQDTTAMHYSDWVAVMCAWLDVRDSLPHSHLEIDHREMVVDVAATTKRIATFLNMSDESMARLQKFLAEHRPEQSDVNFGATYGITELALAPGEADALITQSRRAMDAFSYGYDASYYAPGKPA